MKWRAGPFLGDGRMCPGPFHEPIKPGRKQRRPEKNHGQVEEQWTERPHRRTLEIAAPTAKRIQNQKRGQNRGYSSNPFTSSGASASAKLSPNRFGLLARPDPDYFVRKHESVSLPVRARPRPAACGHRPGR